MSRPTVEFEDSECIQETDAALLVSIDGEEHWIPKSQITDDSEVWKQGDVGTLVITEWIAQEKGLI